jgi:hypothetical protein
MTSETDIYRSAKVLIDQHGDDAAIHAAQRADELLDQGDLEGRDLWVRVLGTRASSSAVIVPCSPPEFPSGATGHEQAVHLSEGYPARTWAQSCQEKFSR